MELSEKVRIAKGGDGKAFYELVESKKDMLYKIAYTYTNDKDNALEIISETVLKAYVSLNKLKNPEFFNTWIVRIHINCCIDYVKKSKKTASWDEKLLTEPIQGYVDREEIMDLKNSLDKLNEKLKTVIILKYFNNLTLTEISQILDYPLGTVKTNLHKALKELRLELKEDFLHE
jgi:RNA polymerase sigma-70 factor, ECF subfamily